MSFRVSEPECIAMSSDGLHPSSDGLHPSSDGLELYI